jgi:hypothetical protein
MPAPVFSRSSFTIAAVTVIFVPLVCLLARRPGLAQCQKVWQEMAFLCDVVMKPL